MKTTILLISFAAIALAAPDCGRTTVSPHLNITMSHNSGNLTAGADAATPYSWPWQIVLCVNNWFSGGCDFECGGSIINEKWVMTAAHCFLEDLNPKSYKVKAGVFDESKNNEEGEQVVTVKSIHIHPRFHPWFPPNDIALIELAIPLNFTDHIQPVCVPNGDADVARPPNNAFVTGWGAKKERSDLSKTLKQVKVPFADYMLCNYEYPGIYQDEVMICAGDEGLNSCLGDYGGPLVLQTGDGRWFQYGITNYGFGCKDDFRGVYTRVSTYCSFIEATTKNAVKCHN